MGIRRDWYQSNERVILALLTKGANDVKVEFAENSLSVTGKDKDGVLFTEELSLTQHILPTESTFKVMSSKIELRLKKAIEGHRWDDLVSAPVATAVDVPKKPDLNQGKKWDKLVKDITEEETKDIEKAGGDAALQQMFKKIYSNANEDTKRAMMKSFQESNGTVLSTNWSEVGKEEVTMKPPDSMEFKKWEG